jgi:hypothetical protein
MEMTEKLLQFIWQFQYFNLKELRLTNGQSLHIIHPGIANTNQGPDFLQARIAIDKTVWAGNIELHIKTSDWYKHEHESDHNYDNVILHVVFEDDEPVAIRMLPTLVLHDRIPGVLLEQYEEWMRRRSFISCETQIVSVPPLVWTNWKERLLISRLERKSEQIKQLLIENNQHWEESFWWLIARNFGTGINGDAFEALARSIRISLLARHKSQIHQLEALLFGQAGLLHREFTEAYPAMLQKEYLFLKKKYGLASIREGMHLLRMRPGNFPTVRLAQLAMLLHTCSHLFSFIKETNDLNVLKQTLQVTANDYWHYHYVFDEPSVYQPKKIGESMTDNIIINTVVPSLFAYGVVFNNNGYKQRALRWMEETQYENNRIIRKFKETGLSVRSAFDTQALLELKKRYCDQQRCLECAVGNALLKRNVV